MAQNKWQKIALPELWAQCQQPHFHVHRSGDLAGKFADQSYGGGSHRFSLGPAGSEPLESPQGDGVPQSPPTEEIREAAPKRTRKAEPHLSHVSPRSPSGLQLTFEVEAGPAAQENGGRPGQPQLRHPQQGTAHAFLVKWRVGLSLQQLSENKDSALLAGNITGPGTAERWIGWWGGGGGQLWD